MMSRPRNREQLNDGPPTRPRPSAAVILLRDAAGGPQVLLVRRNPAQRFMGGYWVFPGGAVDASDGDGDAAHRAAALRELREEAAVDGLASGQLVAYSRWITPVQLLTRFDTRFYVARAPDGAVARVDGVECVDLRWSTPARAVAAYEAGRLELAFPTLTQLRQLAAFASCAEALERARAHGMRPIEPLLAHDGRVAGELRPDPDRGPS